MIAFYWIVVAVSVIRIMNGKEKHRFLVVLFCFFFGGRKFLFYEPLMGFIVFLFFLLEFFNEVHVILLVFNL